MTDRPIEFTTGSAQKMWTGEKTQTRRLITSPAAKFEIGDRLYCREPFRAPDIWEKVPPINIDPITLIPESIYIKDKAAHPDLGRKRPGRFMPRTASKMTLIVREVRRQMLRDITEQDALAEGVTPVSYQCDRPLAMSYFNLWDDLHPTIQSNTNPEIIAITFNAIRKNIDDCPPQIN